MGQLDRFTVSLDAELLAAFDAHLVSRGYQNRSEAVRDLIRDLLLRETPKQTDRSCVGLLTLVCDRQNAETASRLRNELVRAGHRVCGQLLIPVDQRHDAAAIGLRGPIAEVTACADRIQAMRGITQGRMLLAEATDSQLDNLT